MIDYYYLAIFLAFFFATVLAMKIITLKINSSTHEQVEINYFLFQTPILTPATVNYQIPEKKKEILIKLSMRLLFFTLLFLLMYKGYMKLFTLFNFPWIAKAYVLSFFIYIITSNISIAAQILCLPTGKIPIDMHNNPLASANILEFWSKRWNVWVRDWLSNLSSKIESKKRYKRKIFWSFFFSGLFHEIMFQIPYSIYTGKWLLGPMMAYFIIQWFGVVFDYQIKYHASTMVRRFLMWIFLILPCPLFINPAFQYFLNL